MRKPSSALSLIMLAGLGAAVFFGCATSDTPDIGDESGDSGATPPGLVEAPDEPDDDGGDTIGEGDSAIPETDGGKGDADAGPQPIPPPVVGAPWPAPKQGDPCPKADDLAYDWCGACGVTSAICQKQPDGSLKWGKYAGFCENETGACDPNSAPVQEECGNCGTLTKSCSQYGKTAKSCQFVKTACAAEKTCSPGSVEYTAASCDVKGTFQYRYCNATGAMKCEYEPTFNGVCNDSPETFKLPVADGEGKIVTAIVNLTEGTRTVANDPLTGKDLATDLSSKYENRNDAGAKTYYCTEPTAPAPKAYTYLFTEIQNKTNKTATVSLFTDTKLPKNILPTKLERVKIAVYSAKPNMTTNAGRFETCLENKYSLSCSSVSGLPCAGKSGMAAVFTTANGTNVKIGPNQSIFLYVQSIYAINNTSGDATTGNLVVGVRTDKLE